MENNNKMRDEYTDKKVLEMLQEFDENHRKMCRNVTLFCIVMGVAVTFAICILLEIFDLLTLGVL